MSEEEKAVIFVRHVKAHLNKGEVVICKICGKNVDQVFEYENRQELPK